MGKAPIGRHEMGWSLEELAFHKLVRGGSRKPRSLPRDQCPPVPPTLSQCLRLSVSGYAAAIACMHSSYACPISTLEQHRKGCAGLSSFMPFHLQEAPGWVLSYHLAGCTDRRRRVALRLRDQSSPEAEVYSLSGALGCCCACWTLFEG